MMTFKEYREQTKATSRYCLRICGILFSVCFCLIYIFTEALSTPFLKNLLMIAVCILLGNLFAVFIWLLAISTSYARLKNLSKFMNELPKDEKYIMSQYDLIDGDHFALADDEIIIPQDGEYRIPAIEGRIQFDVAVLNFTLSNPLLKSLPANSCPCPLY